MDLNFFIFRISFFPKVTSEFIFRTLFARIQLAHTLSIFLKIVHPEVLQLLQLFLQCSLDLSINTLSAKQIKSFLECEE